MKATKSVILFISLLVISTITSCTITRPSENVPVKKDQIKSVMTSFAAAFSRNSYTDLERIINEHFAPNLVLQYNIPDRSGRRVNPLPMSDLKLGLQMALGVTIENQARYEDVNIEVASDSRSAKVTAKLVEKIIMDRKSATMFYPYLFFGKSASGGKLQIEFSRETKDTMVFEHRDGRLQVTGWKSSIVKAELI